MRAVCPSCRTAYDLPAAAAGRILRCLACGGEWRPPATTRLPAAVPAASPDTSPSPGTAHPLVRPGSSPSSSGRSLVPPGLAGRRPTSPGDGAVTLAWLGSALALALWVGLALRERDAVVDVWPPAARLYAWIGVAS